MTTTSFYAHKGGQGTTTVAAAYAVWLAKQTNDVVLLVGHDIGDLAAVLGVGTPSDDPNTVTEITENLALGHLGKHLDGGYRHVVVDLGVTTDVDGDAYQVIRPCYLALRRAAAIIDHHPIVLVAEPGRALGARDVEHALGASVACEIPVDPSVARAIDAGLLACRMPVALAPLARLAALELSR